MGKINANLADTKPEGAYKYDIVPEGDYDVQIIETEVKETKSGGGFYTILDLRIIDGSQKDKLIKDQITVVNKSVEATKIGLGRLKKIAIIGGHQNPSYIEDSDELLGFKLSAKVALETNKHDGKEYKQNKIKYYDFPNSTNGVKKETSEGPVKKPWE